jgi:hypothetical protein
MPEIDPTSAYAHLIALAIDYQQVIDMIEMGALEIEDTRALLAQRSVLHEQIIAEFARLGQPVTDRAEAMKKAVWLARWYPKAEDDHDL